MPINHNEQVIALPKQLAVQGAVDGPRPRDRMALSEDVQYHHCRSAVLDFLYRKQARAKDKVA